MKGLFTDTPEVLRESTKDEEASRGWQLQEAFSTLGSEGRRGENSVIKAWRELEPQKRTHLPGGAGGTEGPAQQ